MWKEDAVSFPALPETKGFDSSIEHALSLLEDSPVAESTVPEPVRPMVKLTTPASGQTTLVDSIFCDRYCADVNKHTEHCITRYGQVLEKHFIGFQLSLTDNVFNPGRSSSQATLQSRRPRR